LNLYALLSAGLVCGVHRCRRRPRSPNHPDSRTPLFRIAVSLCVLLFGILADPAFAQHDHARGHSEYQNWASRKTGNCCDDKDCGILDDDQVRETTTGPEVKVRGKWCRVLPEHFIIKGRSPDWNKPHACINYDVRTSYGDDCERLLCYSGRGGT
jgi:hypothetical protein